MGNFIDLSRNIEYNEVFDEDFTKLPPNTRLFRVIFPEGMVFSFCSYTYLQLLKLAMLKLVIRSNFSSKNRSKQQI